MNEFDLIQRYFAPLDVARKADDGVVLGIGDDCALLQMPVQQHLAISIDTLVEGVHFLAGTDPGRLGHKTLAVNLSDLAAMGAEPAWFMLCVTLPAQQPAWLEAFAGGMATLARQTGIRLVGGDTTRGPMALTVQVMGTVPVGKALQRNSAKVGDDIYVSGVLGLGGLGLLVRKQGVRDDEDTHLWLDKLETPQPRLALGSALRGVAHACIDVSDGLLQDLTHVLAASCVGATLALDKIPVPSWRKQLTHLSPTLSDQVALRDYCISCGDDYELCFTAPVSARDEIQALSKNLNLDVTRIGEVNSSAGLFDAQSGQTLVVKGYQHF